VEQQWVGFVVQQRADLVAQCGWWTSWRSSGQTSWCSDRRTSVERMLEPLLLPYEKTLTMKIGIVF
jgi:hypothetical protein